MFKNKFILSYNEANVKDLTIFKPAWFHVNDERINCYILITIVLEVWIWVIL